jgi:hypothetical protein
MLSADAVILDVSSICIDARETFLEEKTCATVRAIEQGQEYIRVLFEGGCFLLYKHGKLFQAYYIH